MSERKLSLVVLLFAVILAATIVAAVNLGAVRADLGDILTPGPARDVILAVRLPRVLLAAAVGAVLAVAGVTFQTLLRNPLADPFILGVSGGAACGAAVATAAGLARRAGVIPLVAFGGAAVATAVVFSLARRHGRVDTTRLVLSGLVLNSLFSALILIALALTGGSDLPAALRWMMGSFSNPRWSDVGIVTGALAAALLMLSWFAGDFRLLIFGEEDARSRGVNPERLKLIAFVAGSLATGAAVSVSGIIGFVGLVVPHLVRLLVRVDYRGALPLSALAGAILLVGSDTLARVLVAPEELPVGAITALLGVPFFIYLMRRKG